MELAYPEQLAASLWSSTSYIWKIGHVASIKSVDLTAITYQTPSKLRYQLKQYIDKVVAFEGRPWGGKRILPYMINRLKKAYQKMIRLLLKLTAS